MKWTTYRLADEPGIYRHNAGKLIITTEDGETEICGVVYDESHATLITAAPQMLAALKENLVALRREYDESDDCIKGTLAAIAAAEPEAAVAGGTDESRTTTLPRNAAKNQTAIYANLSALADRLAEAAKLAAEAAAAIKDGWQNLAIGTALPIDDLLSQSKALYDAVIALHRNRR